VLDVIRCDLSNRTLTERPFEVRGGPLVRFVGLCTDWRSGIVLQEMEPSCLLSN
jgi:hypothetical protein